MGMVSLCIDIFGCVCVGMCRCLCVCVIKTNIQKSKFERPVTRPPSLQATRGGRCVRSNSLALSEECGCMYIELNR